MVLMPSTHSLTGSTAEPALQSFDFLLIGTGRQLRGLARQLALRSHRVFVIIRGKPGRHYDKWKGEGIHVRSVAQDIDELQSAAVDSVGLFDAAVVLDSALIPVLEALQAAEMEDAAMAGRPLRPVVALTGVMLARLRPVKARVAFLENLAAGISLREAIERASNRAS